MQVKGVDKSVYALRLIFKCKNGRLLQKTHRHRRTYGVLHLGTGQVFHQSSDVCERTSEDGYLCNVELD